jgi:hypothetical protein
MPRLSMIYMLSSGCRSDYFLYCPTHYGPPCAVLPLPLSPSQWHHYQDPQQGPSKGTHENKLIRLWLLGSNHHSLRSVQPYPTNDSSCCWEVGVSIQLRNKQQSTVVASAIIVACSAPPTQIRRKAYNIATLSSHVICK